MDLIINKPYILENKLISTIEYENKKYDLYFKVNNEYKDYLSDDTANAFLIALIPYIIKHNYNVIIKAKISKKIYYQLSTYLLPMLCEAFNKKPVSIKCELTDEHFNSKGVGASISCGVDSFYTLFKHQKLLDNQRNITHLCFFNAGSNGEYGGEAARELYNERVANIKEFCKKYNYPLVLVDTNMNELIMMNHEKRHTFTTLSCVYALEKLFNTYYFASGLRFDGSHIDEADTAFYDILNMQCLSNENITFYCSGIEVSRLEKIKYISQFKETYDWLNVCVGDKWQNDGKCSKCIRTITALESINKLREYKNVFDLDNYYKNRIKILSNIIKGCRKKIQREFCIEILNSYKENKIRIPILSYILSYRISKQAIKRIFIKKDKKAIKDGWID